MNVKPAEPKMRLIIDSPLFITMIHNYLKIAFRQLFKNKSYVIINTLGMGIALACCISGYVLVAFNVPSFQSCAAVPPGESPIPRRSKP